MPFVELAVVMAVFNYARDAATVSTVEPPVMSGKVAKVPSSLRNFVSSGVPNEIFGLQFTSL